jgi:hypothetical protein
MNIKIAAIPVTILLFLAPTAVHTQQNIHLELGTEELVFDYRSDRCEDLDLPDVFAHAIKTSNGIMLVSGNAPVNYFLFGNDFNSLERSCSPALISGDQWEVDAFDHQEWITSVYSEDGKTIHALVHNEYHDPYAIKCKQGITDPSNPCWYNFISYAKSTDGGITFGQPASPNHLVAMLPFKWNPDAAPRGAPPPHGYMGPSNIIKHLGYFYCMMFGLTSNTDANKSGTCIMRTDDLTSPGSWKIWDGEGFNIPLLNPYASPPQDSSAYLPTFVGPNTLRGLHGSLTWNSYLNQFMLVGTGVYPVNGTETCGFYFSLSDDLLNWSQPQLLRETLLGWSPCARQNPEQAAKNIRQEAYPSLIDHDAPDLSFTSADSTVFLYFMQNMDNWEQGGWGYRRNLVRIPVRFSKKAAPPEFDVDVFPNPFQNATTLRWKTTVNGQNTVIISDVLGRYLTTLMDEPKRAGEQQVVFYPDTLPPGIYFYQLTIGLNQPPLTGKLIRQ